MGGENELDKAKSLEDDDPQNIEIGLKATVHPLNVVVKSNGEIIDKHIDFGLVNVNCRKIERLIVGNMSTVLPIDINFEKMSNFAAHPSSVVINPGCTHIVNLIFAPRQGGRLTQNFTHLYRQDS